MKGIPSILCAVIWAFFILPFVFIIWILGGHKPFTHFYDAIIKTISYEIKDY